MALVLGIDTGGTFTDAAVVDFKNNHVLYTAKSFTTRSNLVDGIINSIEGLGFNNLNAVGMVCLSTTLATNAIVENRRGKTALVSIGKKGGLTLPGSAEYFIDGLFDIKGREQEPLDSEALADAVEELKGVRPEAVAVSGYASVRNPAHEIRIAEVIRSELNLPVVCAHELSSSLGFEDRTLTAVLNAGLIPVIGDLVESVKHALSLKGITARLMVVRGDGSLMDEKHAVMHPIDTILSGPAASVLGGVFLSGRKDAVVLDMGGTTTDIAEVRNGRVNLQSDGAVVGGRKTHVRAAEIYTYGIGGDSRIMISADKRVSVGPVRVKPLCVAAAEYPHLLDEIITCRKPTGYELLAWHETDCFAYTGRNAVCYLDDDDRALIECLKKAPHSLFYLADKMKLDAELLNLDKLVDCGLVERIGLTPTDLLHARGRFTEWNRHISEEAFRIAAEGAALKPEDLLDITERRVIEIIADAIIASGSGLDEKSFQWRKLSPLLSISLRLKSPLVAIGAPAAEWVPAAAKILNVDAEIPEHAGVANAVGAATGRITESAEITIRYSDTDKIYSSYSPWGREVFTGLEEAKKSCSNKGKVFISGIIGKQGSSKPGIECEIKDLFVGGYSGKDEKYIETRIKIHGTGVPDWISE